MVDDTNPERQQIRITRAELDEFLPNPRTVKQFENLVSNVNETTTIVRTEIPTETGDAIASAASLAAQLEDLKRTLDLAPTPFENNKIETDLLGLQLAPPLQITNQPRYGFFYDTTTQTAALANTAYPITFDTTVLSLGAALGSPTSRVSIDRPGICNVQYTVTALETAGGIGTVWTWLKLNGTTDLVRSATRFLVRNNGTVATSSSRVLVQLAAGDYLEVYWATDDTNIQLTAYAATAFAPAVPSATISIIENISALGV